MGDHGSKDEGRKDTIRKDGDGRSNSDISRDGKSKGKTVSVEARHMCDVQNECGKRERSEDGSVKDGKRQTKDVSSDGFKDSGSKDEERNDAGTDTDRDGENKGKIVTVRDVQNESYLEREISRVSESFRERDRSRVSGVPTERHKTEFDATTSKQKERIRSRSGHRNRLVGSSERI